MSAITQIIRWRQGRAVIVPRRPKPQPKPATPNGGGAAASAPSVKVSIGANNGAAPEATYTDRIKKSAKLKAQLAAKAARAIDPRRALADAKGSRAADTALRQHVREILEYVKAADTAALDLSTTAPYDTTPVDAAAAAVRARGSAQPASPDAGVGGWEQRAYDLELQIQAAAQGSAGAPAGEEAAEQPAEPKPAA